jgi:hypothetical protein
MAPAPGYSKKASKEEIPSTKEPSASSKKKADELSYISFRVTPQILSRIEEARKKCGEESFAGIEPSRAEWVRDVIIEKLMVLDKKHKK